MEYIGEGSLNDIRSRIFKRRGTVTLGSNGQATIAFDPPIKSDREPYVQLQPWVASGGNPIIANPVQGTLTTSAPGVYTGVTIKAERTQDMPASIISVTVLAGRRVTETSSLNGARVDWIIY